MFSSSPVGKAPATPSSKFGGFIVTEEDYVPRPAASPVHTQTLEKPGSDYSSVSWEMHMDAVSPNTIAAPHFSSTSLTGFPSNGNNGGHFQTHDDTIESRRFSVGGGSGFTVSADAFDAQPPNPWRDSPSFGPRPYSSQALPRRDQNRRDAHNDPNEALNGTSFARHGGYGNTGSVSSHSRGERSTPFTYHGPGGEHNRSNRLHQDFKALSKEERQRLVEKEAAATDLVQRTVHLRFLPTCMRQSELAEICTSCGEYLRVRICGNAASTQNWIYGFVEFATKEAAERMLAKSGMELFNGQGRPPLRLKCNAAKQPIVDRVFHDADPESNSPCIFGLGNFASRSLKDALESYFNLKVKEQQAQQQQDRMQQLDGAKPNASPFLGSASSQGGTSPQLNSMGTSITSGKLSPQAKAFVPGQGFFAGDGRSSLTDLTPSVHSPQGRITPMSMPSASRAAEDVSGATSSNDETSESAAHVTPLQEGRLPSSALSDFLVSKSAGGRTPMNFTPTSRDAPGHLLPPPAYGLSQENGSSLSTPNMGFSTAIAASRPSDSLFGLDAHGAVPIFATTPLTMMSAGGPLAPRPASPFVPATLPRTDAEVVVQRASQLAVNGLRLAENFLRTNDGFFDAVGTLRALLDLLNRNSALTGGPANTTSRDFTAELPQKTTRLLLFANVVLAVLYLGRRAFTEALPFIQAAVTVCKAIGHEPLSKPSSMLLKHAMTHCRNGAHVSPTSTNTSSRDNSPPGRSVGGEQPARQARAVDETMGAFFANQNLDDIIYTAIDEPSSDPSKPDGDGSVPNPVSGRAEETLEALYVRDVHFHSYVWNALIALGIALEEVRPEIAHSVFNLASSQARDVLHMTSPLLDKCLSEQTECGGDDDSQTSSRVRLCALLFPDAMTRSCDITTFPRLFFQKSRELPLEGFLESDEDEFWYALPPNHCVQCFPA